MTATGRATQTNTLQQTMLQNAMKMKCKTKTAPFHGAVFLAYFTVVAFCSIICCSASVCVALPVTVTRGRSSVLLELRYFIQLRALYEVTQLQEY